MPRYPMPSFHSVTFRPAAVEGVTFEVDRVTIYGDRIELAGEALSRTLPLIEASEGVNRSRGLAGVGRELFVPAERGLSTLKFYFKPDELVISLPDDSPAGRPARIMANVGRLLKAHGFELYDRPRSVMRREPLPDDATPLAWYLLAAFAIGWLLTLACALPGGLGEWWQWFYLRPEHPRGAFVHFSTLAAMCFGSALVSCFFACNWRQVIVVGLLWWVVAVANHLVHYHLVEIIVSETVAEVSVLPTFYGRTALYAGMVTVGMLVGRTWRGAFAQP